MTARSPTSGRPLRYLVVHLPAFRLERCGYDAADLACLVAEVKNATRIVAHTPAARHAGLRHGMTAAEARSLVPDVELLPFDPVAERADRHALVGAFEQLSDRVAFPWPDHVVLEVSCTSHLFGGEPGTLARAREIAESFGHRCTVAIADDPLGAAALADEDVIVPPGALARHLAALPVAQLCFEPSAVVAQLRAIGIERVGDLARLDPASVSGRYGPEGVRLHGVARGLPTTGRELGWGDADGELPKASARLAGATSTLQLHFVLPGLLADLVDQLGRRDLAVVRLKLVLRLEGRSLPPATLGVGVGRPTRSQATLERLIRTRLEGLRIDAPVDELVLEVVEAVPEQGWQPGLTDRTEATEPLPELLARLRDHLGEDALVTPRLADAWRPEGAWKPLVVGNTLPVEPPALFDRGVASDDPVEVQQAWEQALTAPRPTLLLPDPLPIEVALRDGRPARVRLPTGTVRVTRCDGPERLEGEWWSPTTRFDRAYWVVELDGRAAWIFEEHGRWALHGWFD